MRVRRLVFVLLGCAGCSLVIDGDLISVHCEDEGAFGPPACPEHQRCVQNICVSGQAAAPSLGSRCTHDTDCDDGDFCLDPTRFGGPGPSVCSRPCCASSSCDPDDKFVCWSPDVGGGDFCVAATILGREQLGHGEPGVACTGGASCRSGLCVGGHCSDPCCTDTNCAASERTCPVRRGTTARSPGRATRPTTSGRPTGEAARRMISARPDSASPSAAKPRCSVPCCLVVRAHAAAQRGQRDLRRCPTRQDAGPRLRHRGPRKRHRGRRRALRWKRVMPQRAMRQRQPRPPCLHGRLLPRLRLRRPDALCVPADPGAPRWRGQPLFILAMSARK